LTDQMPASPPPSPPPSPISSSRSSHCFSRMRTHHLQERGSAEAG
jgi:hypothetical protein